MIKFILGIVIGIGLATYYPEISNTLKDFFLDSGARDSIVEYHRKLCNHEHFSCDIVGGLRCK